MIGSLSERRPRRDDFSRVGRMKPIAEVAPDKEIVRGTDLTQLTQQEIIAGIAQYANEETADAYCIHQDLIAYLTLLELAARNEVKIIEACIGSQFVLDWDRESK